MLKILIPIDNLFDVKIAMPSLTSVLRSLKLSGKILINLAVVFKT